MANRARTFGHSNALSLASVTSRTPSFGCALGPKFHSPIQGVFMPQGQVPGSGRVNGFAIDPRNTNVVYAAASIGGVWQTEDGGRLIPTVFNFSNQMTAGPDPSNLKGESPGDALASFMVGAGNPGAGAGGSTGFNAFPAPTYYLHGMYVQDDWKATRRLTLNLGFRYDIQMPPTARHNQQAYFDLHALNPISSVTGIPVFGQIVYNTPGDRGLYRQNLNDFAPRLGFAFAVSQKLVLRGGYGIYYARNFYGGNGPNPGYSTSSA